MLLLSAALCYLLGSIPWGFVAGQLRGVDVRAVGSGNIGTTNVWRILGPGIGTLVFALDVAKGLAAPFLGRALLGDGHAWGIALCAVMAVVGHTFSIFLKGRGGKGIATGLGMILGLSWQVALSALAVWLIVLTVWRMISVASVVACLAVLVGMMLVEMPLPFRLVLGSAALLAIWKHLPNMKRVLAGTEPKVGARKTAVSAGQ